MRGLQNGGMGYSQAPEQLQNQESQELKRQNRSLFNTYLSLLKDCSPLKKLPLPICEAQDLERIFVDIVKDRADQVKQLEFDEGFFKEIVDHGKIKKLTDELNSLESISAKNALIDRRETADFIKDVIKEKLELLDLSGNHLSADAWGHAFNKIKRSNIKELRLSLHRVDTTLLEDLCSESHLCAETLKKLLSHLQKERKERLLASQHRSNGPQNDEVTTLKFIHPPLSQDKILEIQREVIREGMKTSGDQLSLASALESIFSRAILIWLPFDAASSRLTNSEERKRKWESLIPKKNHLNEFFNDAATGGNIVTRLHINVRYLESSESVKQSGTTEDTLFLSVSRIRKVTWGNILRKIGSRQNTQMVCNDEFKMIFVAGNGPYQWSNFMANENMREFVAGELFSERLPVHFEEKWARDLIGSSNSCDLSIGNGVPNLYFIEASSKCTTLNIVNLHICLPVQAKELFLTFRVEEIAKFGEVGNILDPKKGILNIDKTSFVLFGVRILSHPNTKVAVIFLRKLDSDKSIAIDTDATPATPAPGSVSDRSDAGRSAVAGSDSDRSAASGSDSDKSAASGSDSDRSAASSSDPRRLASAGSDSDRSAASGSDSGKSAASGSDSDRSAASSSDPGSLAGEVSDPRRLASAGSDLSKSVAEGSDSGKSVAEGSDSSKSVAEGSDSSKSVAEGSDSSKSVAEGSDSGKSATSGPDMATPKTKRMRLWVPKNRKGSSTINDAGVKDNETPPGCVGESARDVPKKRLEDPRSVAAGSDSDRSAASGSDSDRSAASSSDPRRVAGEVSDPRRLASAGSDLSKSVAEGSDSGKSVAEGSNSGKQSVAEGSDSGKSATSGPDMATPKTKRMRLWVPKNRKGSSTINDAGVKDNETPPGCVEESARDVPKKRLEDPRSVAAGSDSDRSAASGSDSDRSAASSSDPRRVAGEVSDPRRLASAGSDLSKSGAEGSDSGKSVAEGSDSGKSAASGPDMATPKTKRMRLWVPKNRKGSSTINDAGVKDNETPPGCVEELARDVPKKRLEGSLPKKAEDVDQTSILESNNFETGDSDNLDTGQASKSPHDGSDDLSTTGSDKPSSADSRTSNTAKPGASNDADSNKAPLNPEEVMEKFKKARSTFSRKKNWLKEDKGHTRRIFLVPTGDLGKNDHTLTSPQPLVENNYLWGSNISNLERVYCRLRPGDILLFSSAKMGFFNRVARVKRIYIVKAEFTNQLWEENKTVMNRKSIKNDGWPVLILVDQPHNIEWNKVDTMADCGYSGSAKLQGPLLPEPKKADKILKQCLQVLGLEEALSFNEKNQPFPIIPDVVERNGKWIVTTMFESE